MEWFYNLGQWFIDNKDAIVTWLSGIDILGLISLIIMSCKQNKNIIDNTKSTNGLNSSIQSNDELKSTIKLLQTELKELETENAELKHCMDKMVHNEELLVTKFNAMLDVQSVVYATLKDVTTRTTVSNILANAKYTENTAAEKIKEELLSLKTKVIEQTNKSVTDIDDAITKTTELANDGNTVTTRY